GKGRVRASPHVLEPPSGLSFGDLLDWHLRRGTRPPGSDKQGEPWKKASFASDVGVSDKQVRNWIANKSLPNDIITIERVLFGRDQEQCTVWRMELRDALKRTRTGSAPTRSAPRGQASVAPSSVMPAVPRVPRLSIVVLPFGNLSSDPGQDYFVDGVTEDLTTELSRLADSFVIAHNTAFTFKGKSVDVKQVARELGVRYVVEGNVRKAGQRVRVGAQLIDAETGAHLWADRFDREISELFALQDAITIELANALDVQLILAEGRRCERSTNPDAVDLVMRARAHLYHGVSRANSVAAIQQYRAALQLAPDDVRALAELADVLATNIASLWSEAR